MDFKYNKALTVSHPICAGYNVLTDINGVLLRDGCDVIPTPFLGREIQVIDGDELERFASIAFSRQVNKSVDIMFAIENAERSIQYCQLVELKFNCTNFYYLLKDSFQEKVEGSKLAMGSRYQFSPFVYIVFNSRVINQARRYLFRTNPSLNNTFKAIVIDRLSNLFFVY